MVLTVKISRPITKFDATNREHRNDYNLFRKQGSWKNSKNLYDLEFPFDSIPHLCTSKLLDFYLENDKRLTV